MESLKRPSILLIFASALVVLAGCGQESAVENVKSSKFQAKEQPVESLNGPYKVVKVTDGDTIHVMRGGTDIRVRIIGVNTPEVFGGVQCFGPEASQFARAEMENTTVYLEYDSSQQELDKYGRVLAHVWTSERRLYAAEAILEGFGSEKTYAQPYHHRELFLANQKLAEDQDKGLWGSCKN